MTDNSLDIAKSELKGLQKQVRSRLLFNTSLNALNVLLLILQAWWVAGLLHAYVIDSTVPQDLNWIVTGLLVTALLRACLHYFSQVQAYKVAQHIKDKLRTKMYDSVVQSGAALVTAEGSATIHNVLAKGIEAMDSYFADYLPTLQLAAVAPVILLCALFPADATAGWVLLGLAPLIPIVMIWVGKAAGKLNQKQWRTLARLGVQLLDRIQGIRMLKAYGRSRAEAQFIFQASENYRTETMRVLRVAFLSSLALEFFATISVALVAVIVGFKLYYAQSTYLYGMFVLLLAPEFFVALRQMGVYYHAKMDAVSAAEQMLTLQQAEQATAENFPLLQANAPVTIELKQLSHNYGEIRALQGVDLTIAAGKITAIIGESGAGKSTLLKLLMGLLNPQHGELRLNGQVLSSFNHPNWWNHVAWVGQRVAVLQATIAENVHMFATEVNLSRVQEAIAFAELDEWVATQESGIDTMLEEGGHNLSGGQMQRLALARAYYKDAEVLVFDELTAYLDSATETAILAKVALMAKGKTTLMVTHRYPSMQLADEWVVLETGQVKRHGAAANLLADEALMSQLNVDGVEDSVEHGNEGDA